MIDHPDLDPSLTDDLALVAKRYTEALIAYHCGTGSYDMLCLQQNLLNDLCREAAATINNPVRLA